MLVFQQLRGTPVDDWMIIHKKVSKPELAVEAITAESDASTVAASAAKMLNFEVCICVEISIVSVWCPIHPLLFNTLYRTNHSRNSVACSEGY